MNRPLWVQKLSDERLKKMIEYADTIELSRYERAHEEVWNILSSWYRNDVGKERLMAFVMDVRKEATFRWTIIA